MLSKAPSLLPVPQKRRPAKYLGAPHPMPNSQLPTGLRVLQGRRLAEHLRTARDAPAAPGCGPGVQRSGTGRCVHRGPVHGGSSNWLALAAQVLADGVTKEMLKYHSCSSRHSSCSLCNGVQPAGLQRGVQLSLDKGFMTLPEAVCTKLHNRPILMYKAVPCANSHGDLCSCAALRHAGTIRDVHGVV